MRKPINRRLIALATLSFLVHMPAALRAAPPSPEQRLERGALCLEVMDYSCVQSELKALRVQLGSLPSAQKRRVIQLSVESLLSQKKWELARQSIKELLKLAPDFRPQEGAWPPKWNQIYEETRSLLPDSSPPSITLISVTPNKASGPWELRVALRDPSGIGSVRLFVRAGSVEHELLMATQNGLHWHASIPKLWAVRASDGSARVSFWVTAMDLKGNGPGTLGSVAEPKTLRFLAPPVQAPGAASKDSSILSRWWFWTALGTAAIAGGAAVYLLSNDSGTSGPLPYGTGNLRVNIAWP